MAIKGLLVQPKTAWKIRIEPASTSTMTTQGLVFGQKSSAPPSEESSPCPHGLHVILCSKTSVCSMSMSLRCPPSTSSHGAPRPCNPPCNGRSRRPERPGKKHARALRTGWPRRNQAVSSFSSCFSVHWMFHLSDSASHLVVPSRIHIHEGRVVRS